MPPVDRTARGFLHKINLPILTYPTLFCILFVLVSPRLSIGQSQLINGDRVIAGHLNYCDATGSTGDAYVCSLSQTITGYVTGAHYLFKAPNASTAAGGTTLNLNGIGAKTIVKVVGGVTTALADNDIRAGQFVDVVYDGTNMQMQSTLANLPASLLANGANCSAGSFPLGVDASGIAESCTDVNTVPQTRSIYIPAGSMDVEGTCAANATAVLVTTGPKLVTIGCTDTNTDGIDFDFVMPDGWDAGTITIELDAFSIGNNSTEVFSMNFSGQCVRGGSDAVAAHTVTSGATATSTTNRAATITWPAAANREEHATTAPLTLNGTCAAGAHVYMHGLVDATTTTMTPMTDLKILGVKVEYQRTAND